MIDLSRVSEPQIVKEGDKVTTYQVVKQEIDLSPLRYELAQLESEVKPSEAELLEHALMGLVHPYYDPGRQVRIDWLKAEIDRLEV